MSAGGFEWDGGEDAGSPRPCAEDGVCGGGEFHRGRERLVVYPCHVLHVECDWACDGTEAKFYAFGLGEFEHGGCEEVRVDLSGVAVTGHRGVRVSERFFDPAQVVWETFSFPLFRIGVLQLCRLLKIRFATSVVGHLRSGVGKRGVFLAAAFPIPAVDKAPLPALRAVM